MLAIPPISLTLVLGLILGVALLLVFMMSAILLYHWWRYGMHAPAIFLAGVLYFAGVIFFAMVSISFYGALR